jgi:hypothetical protein|tara:strand:+ start:376 stop:651 length:276 start_codon:yes stop_codon:yes gene_type:complete
VNERKAYHLGLLIDLTPNQVHEALDMFYKVSRDKNWDTIRNNQCLLIDCIYIIGKKYKVGITLDTMIDLTKELYGVSTQPKPHVWRERYGY